MTALLVGAVCWLAGSAAAAIVIGKAIRNADCAETRCPCDGDLMALVQPENLSPAEVDRRAIERSWWA